MEPEERWETSRRWMWTFFAMVDRKSGWLQTPELSFCQKILGASIFCNGTSLGSGVAYGVSYSRFANPVSFPSSRW